MFRKGSGQSVSVRRQEVETIEYNRDKGLGISVYIGQRRGHASSSDFSLGGDPRPRSMPHLSIARFTAEDDCAGLPEERSLLARKSEMDLDLFHPWDISVEDSPSTSPGAASRPPSTSARW
jgi:PmbA protein